MKKLICIIAFSLTLPAHAQVQDLLLTEISTTPFGAEFVEIHNKGANVIDLSDVYITDATYSNGNTYYYQLVSGGGGGGDFADFFARFPDGASIAPGAYQTIALNGSDNFTTAFSATPTYELYEDGSPDAIANMREATIGSISGQGGLTDAGEVVVLFYWDGQSDLVQDLDYVLWGDKTEAIDKTNIQIDGPDVDFLDSSYLNDTAITSQATLNPTVLTAGKSWQRSDMNEGLEVKTGGNGITGHDETSENIDVTFFEDTASPNAAAPSPPVTQVLINEVDVVSSNAEFIELLGPAGVSLDGLTMVLYNGNTDQVYNVIGLNGYNIDSNGYLLIGNSSVSPDILISSNGLEDGADAVAVYASDVANFNVGDSISTVDIMDALVYDSGQADDVQLLSLLNNGQAQINEDQNGSAASEAMARCPHGSGGSLNTITYQAVQPTPGTVNNLCPIGGYYDTADDTNANTLRNSLHEIIDDHTTFPYSSGSTDTWDVLSFADEDPTDSSKVWMIYKNNSYTWQGGGQQAYNREHTWPQSRGFSSGAMGDDNAARTDMHHLMLSDVDYNGDRGNKYFDNCDSGCTELTTTTNHGEGGQGGGDSSWTNGSVFEVWDFRKGDIARAMFYMDVRYSGDVTGEVDLQLTDNTALINGTAPYMGLLSVLIEWHNQDPVDGYELERNERVYSYQENRNPFIDHPEWVECIFVNGGTCNTTGNDLIFENGFEPMAP